MSLGSDVAREGFRETVDSLRWPYGKECFVEVMIALIPIVGAFFLCASVCFIESRAIKRII